MKVEVIIKSRATVDLEITGATLLSIEEAKGLPDHLRTHTNWWWLRSPGDNSSDAASVGGDGSVDYTYSLVSISLGAVRPALRIKNFESSDLKIGDFIIFDGKEFEIVSGNLAFCKTDIGEHCFQEDWDADDANDYEKSDVKKFIDNWFERAIKKE